MMRVHGVEITDEQIAAGLAAMKGKFVAAHVVLALKSAGVPEQGPPRGMWIDSKPAYRGADALIQRERRAGRIKHIGAGKWQRVGE